MGDEADDIMAGFCVIEEKKELHASVKNEFDGHFLPKPYQTKSKMAEKTRPSNATSVKVTGASKCDVSRT